jgi:hypothetical protein
MICKYKGVLAAVAVVAKAKVEETTKKSTICAAVE